MKEPVYIGQHGINPTTHCYVTRRILGNAPINYSLGLNRHYVSVNVGQCLSAKQLREIVNQLPKTKKAKKKKR